MPGYEYKVVPAPKKAGKIKGARGTDQKFAGALAELMNQYGRDGWEYQRTDTLPCEERQGLTGKTTTFQNMLIFRKEIMQDAAEPVEMSIRTPATAASVQGAQADTLLAVPRFRATVAEAARPALAAVTQDAPQGRAPSIGAPHTREPSQQSGIAAQ